MRFGLVGVVLFGTLLACSGLPTSIPVPDAAVEPEEGAASVDDLLDAEDPKEGEKRSAEAREERKKELTAFVSATPDFEEWRPVVIDLLASDQVSKTEEAYTKAKADFAPKPPVVAEVKDDAWKVVVVVTHAYDTSEDWAAFGDEVSKGLSDDGATVVKAGPGEDEVKVQKEGKDLETIDLKAATEDKVFVGYVFARPGADPQAQAHGPAADVIAAGKAYFSGEAPAEGGEGGEGGPGGRTKVKVKVKAKRPVGEQP